MSVVSGVARAAVLSSTRISSWRLAQVTPGRQAVSVLANRLVPRLAKRAFRPGVHDVNGARLLIPGGTGVGAGGEHYMALGTYEMGEVRFILGRLGPGGGMIDVGAHIGYFAIAAAAAVGPTGRVIAIEPTPPSAETLRRNVELNGFADRVTVVEAAASDHTGTGALHVSGTSDMWNTLEPDTLEGNVTTRQVDVTTIDDVLEREGWPPIQVLKMDVEGHERSVLRGAAGALARYPELRILFEACGATEERFRVSSETISHLADDHFGFSVVDSAGRATPATVAQLEQRMHLPRWQDALFNVVAHRAP